MPYVEATGAKLYFEESGYGYPIIFIHEFASDIRGWEAQVRYFSRSLPLHRLQRQGISAQRCPRRCLAI